MTARERIALLQKEIEYLQPIAARERRQNRLIQVETAVDIHERQGWPEGEDDYKQRLLLERDLLRRE